MSASKQLFNFQSLASLTSSNPTNAPREAKGIYSGFDKSGLVKLIIDGKKILGCGKLFLSQTYQNADGKTKRKRVLKCVSIGYVEKSEPETLVRCTCKTTGLQYRFVGVLMPYEEKTASILKFPQKPAVIISVEKRKRQIAFDRSPEKATICRPIVNTIFAAETSTESEQYCEAILNDAPVPQLEKNNTEKSPARKNRCFDIQAELELITAQRTAGMDPLVTVRIACIIVRESRASLYRKMHLLLFPFPIKRGHQSFLYLSQLEAYKKGAWSPP